MRKSYDLENPHSDDIEKGIKKTSGQYRIVRKAKGSSSKNSNTRRRSSSLSYYTPKSSSGIGYGQYVDIEKLNSKGGRITKRKSMTLKRRKTRSTKF